MLKLSGPLSSIPNLCLANPSSFAIERTIALLPKTIEEWEDWLQCVQHNRVESQVYSSILQHQLKIPTWVMTVLFERNQKVRLQNRLRREKFVELLKALKEQQVPVILLKGNALAKEVYGDYDYKQMNDFDLLFQESSLKIVFQIYQDFKYVSLASLGKNPRNQEAYSHHWPPYFNADLTLFLGTHWNLINPFSSIKIHPEDLWNRADTISYEGYPVLRLSKEDFIHHLCIHLSPYKVGVKELADIYNALIHWTSFNWKIFFEIVEQAKSYNSVYRALSLSQSLISLKNVADFLDSIKEHVDPRILAEVEQRTDVPENILRTRTTHISKIEKTYALFSLSDNPFEKTHLLSRMWRLFLLPPLKEAAHLCFVPYPKNSWNALKCRAQAPLLIARALAHEMGWKVFILVSLSHQWNLLRSWLRFLVQPKSVGLREKAKQLGINLTQLTAATTLD